jgi:SIR2-like domain
MFPDIANVHFIREALWRHKAIGNASIMIGAGFSRNADPISGSARPMPDWVEMAKALCAPLYPSDQARLDAAILEASGTSGFLRLAQEYHTAFGPSALSNRIRDLVPDLEHRPSDLHKRLLRLPWADIFSTNWDTLLERSCADVFERSYDIVRTIEQIPYATRPRIVKLHGTFPAHEPFIFTEEDYRTFPAKFAPFVNLVQQSMMETSFCLLGFSGDDPNFLHWSGWVRDNLSASAPKIYLVGWLELSVHRRRMLEARNVMPVDLSSLPQAANWPRELRHRYAADWFIKALEMAQPYNVSSWPSAGGPSISLPPHLGFVPPITSPVPQAEPYPQSDNQKPERVNLFRRVLQAWAHNRRLYPGWMIAPEHIRRALWAHTSPGCRKS